MAPIKHETQRSDPCVGLSESELHFLLHFFPSADLFIESLIIISDFGNDFGNVHKKKISK